MGSEFVYQSVWRVTRKLQARESLGWTIPRKFQAANYRHFTVCIAYLMTDSCDDQGVFADKTYRT